jgi:hypothetical protein
MSEKLIHAIETYKLRPEALTAEMIALITKADAELGAQAQSSLRAAKQRAAEESRAEAIVALVKRALKDSPRIAALEERVLQLEARAAVAAEEPEHDVR